MFKEYIISHRDDMLKDLEKIIKVPSKLEGYDNPEYPFGKNVDEALNEFLKIAESLGFKTKNIDKKCGYVGKEQQLFNEWPRVRSNQEAELPFEHRQHLCSQAWKAGPIHHLN